MKRKEMKEIQKEIEETISGSFYVTKEGDIGKCLGKKLWQCQNCIFDGGVNSISCLESRVKWLNEEIFDTSKYIKYVVDIFANEKCHNDCDNCDFKPRNFHNPCDEFLTKVLKKGLEAMGYH